MTIPRIIIAGTHSGCGKTTVASGIMGALTKEGYTVQPFKVGPDFIDPTHHTRICGRISRNLDPFMMGEEECRASFSRASAGADIAVVEGVMGMFDGVDGSDLSSTAHVARLLQAPVILVVDAKGMSRSIHALIKGFMTFDPTVTIAGVIVNRTGSRRHREMMEPSLAIPAFGWIPRSEAITLKSRHLGLLMAHESGSHDEISDLIAEHCDLEAIISAAGKAPAIPVRQETPSQVASRARIGVARDNAFCFYYQDNLELLRKTGAELVFFSPLQDRLPQVDALYLGGGYPELFLPQLEVAACTTDISKAARDGLPVFAECGGLMYLTREVKGERTCRMTGILPAIAEMTNRIQALGYVKGTVTGTGSFLPQGRIVAGHEFHYSRLVPDKDARYVITLSRGMGITDGKDGLAASNTVGMYTHSYFTPAFARDFVDAAVSFSRS
ncbi:MAG: cobyrinate a,c-diamide synthase [Methanoregula sp.]|jgi:cobyrinic acid a,c-diamide synthase|uniref:cobyrinate a,c-diamide synthase n=1 Tax=Methanoregula sp. TaxID=2052170 RepID=UPI0025F4A39D|nr:cobyrinate a,c-diamide synthase [Methanoregula sp.]MCK9632067.1 cobyrinate a,c-diamide synthase [Methanoregula sp.]